MISVGEFCCVLKVCCLYAASICGRDRADAASSGVSFRLRLSGGFRLIAAAGLRDRFRRVSANGFDDADSRQRGIAYLERHHVPKFS